MFKRQSNSVKQKQEHRQLTSLIKASGQRSVAVGHDINAPIFLGNVRDSVVKIYGSWSPWLWAILLTMLSVTLLTLAAVTLPVLDNQSETQVLSPSPTPSPSPNPNPTAPDGNDFKLVTGLDLNLAVTALVLGLDESSLWIGTESKGKYSLYQLETGQEAKKAEHILDVEEEIIKLMVDCKGNLWLLLNEKGALVYQPQTGERSTLLNRKTTNDWLSKNTTQAIASRCINDDQDGQDKEVEVWLGREGVHTLRYSNDYPSIETIEFVPWADDKAFTNSKELTDVRALEYVAQDNMLWVASLTGELRGISYNGVLQPKIIRVKDPLWSLSQSGDRIIWAGGGEHLIQIDGKNIQTKKIPLVEQNGTDLDNRAFALAAGQDGLWFGDDCSKKSSPCWPLGVYAQDHLFPIDLGNTKNVRVIVIDKRGAVWIGTENGLIFYSES